MFNREGPISIASPSSTSSDTTSSNGSSSNASSSNASTSYATSQRKPPTRASYYRDTGSIWRYLLATAFAACIAASCYFVYFTYSVYQVRPRITALEQKQKALESQQAELDKRLHARLSEFRQTLSSEVGTTKQEITLRAAELEEQQKAAAARLAAAQSQQSKQLAAVSGEVSSVKNDVGSAKADIQKTQTDLVATNAKLEHAMGDLGVQSGLIAHNATELQELRRKGERNYYDFTLQKNTRARVANVSLVLKKVDPKKSTFTLNVLVDDKMVEKKDRTLGEPLQFYTGPDHILYELVVFTANKTSITGYLSTPKGAAQPAMP
jgi:cell division protein FtsL